MLPNIHKDDNVRFNLLCDAIKQVYASTFYKEAAALIESSIHALEEEKMDGGYHGISRTNIRKSILSYL